ncbi:unnamed protein product, partial [Staurois parvus]
MEATGTTATKCMPRQHDRAGSAHPEAHMCAEVANCPAESIAGKDLQTCVWPSMSPTTVRRELSWNGFHDRAAASK